MLRVEVPPGHHSLTIPRKLGERLLDTAGKATTLTVLAYNDILIEQ